MAKFYVTFGQKYAREPHPANPGIHPDGVVVVEAESEAVARSLAFEVLGRNWAFLDPWSEHTVRRLYPSGAIGEITPDGRLVMEEESE